MSQDGKVATSVPGDSYVDAQARAQEIVKQYKWMQRSVEELARKINELGSEQNEHLMVVNALKDLDPQRRCFRLLSGVLVERTVGEVLPAVRGNLEKIREVIDTLKAQLDEKRTELNDYRVKHNIRAASAEEQQEALSEQDGNSSSGKSSGILVQ